MSLYPGLYQQSQEINLSRFWLRFKQSQMSAWFNTERSSLWSVDVLLLARLTLGSMGGYCFSLSTTSVQTGISQQLSNELTWTFVQTVWGWHATSKSHISYIISTSAGWTDTKFCSDILRQCILMTLLTPWNFPYHYHQVCDIPIIIVLSAN